MKSDAWTRKDFMEWEGGEDVEEAKYGTVMR